MAKRWSEQEIQILKDNYKDKSKEEILQLLLGKTWSSIQTKAAFLKILKNPRWTNREIKFLKNNYDIPNKKAILIKTLYNRSWMSIKNKARILGINTNYEPWNKKEINDEFFDEWSNEMAYVLGVFVSDGNMIYYKRGGYKFSFTQKGKEILEKIAKLMKWEVVIRACKETPTQFTIEASNKYIYNQLLKLGMTPRKSLTIKFPYVPKKYMRHFIRGIFDGDGSIVLNNKCISCSFASGSISFISKLISVLATYGINTSKYYTSSSTIQLGKKNSIKLFHYMYDNVSKEMYMERKYNRFIEYFKIRGIKYKKEKIQT